LLSDKFKGRMG